MNLAECVELIWDAILYNTKESLTPELRLSILKTVKQIIIEGEL